MVGREMDVPAGYRGLVLGKLNQQTTGYMSFDSASGAERVDFEVLGAFGRVTEWKKDAWTQERAYASNLLDYLECAKILHGEDEGVSANGADAAMSE